MKVAFIHDRPAEVSSWAYTHELGRMQLEQVFGDEIHTDAYFLKESDGNIGIAARLTLDMFSAVLFSNQKKETDLFAEIQDFTGGMPN